MDKLVLLTCPHGISTIGVESGPATINLTGSRCCGRWTVAKSWTLTADEWGHLARVAEQCADEGG